MSPKAIQKGERRASDDTLPFSFTPNVILEGLTFFVFADSTETQDASVCSTEFNVISLLKTETEPREGSLRGLERNEVHRGCHAFVTVWPVIVQGCFDEVFLMK